MAGGWRDRLARYLGHQRLQLLLSPQELVPVHVIHTKEGRRRDRVCAAGIREVVLARVGTVVRAQARARVTRHFVASHKRDFGGTKLHDSVRGRTARVSRKRPEDRKLRKMSRFSQCGGAGPDRC
jgi:hypothetical protein